MNMRTLHLIRAAILTSLFLCLFITPFLSAGGRRRAVAVSPASSQLSVTFVDALESPAGFVDAGTIVWRGGRNAFTATKRTFGMRIGQPSREARGTATVRAFLETADLHCTIRLDGIVLTAVPQVIQLQAPIGVVVTHRLQIEVPVTAPEGALNTSIGWEITAN